MQAVLVDWLALKELPLPTDTEHCYEDIGNAIEDGALRQLRLYLAYCESESAQKLGTGL
jgi:hypothetical protein